MRRSRALSARPPVLVSDLSDRRSSLPVSLCMGECQCQAVQGAGLQPAALLCVCVSVSACLSSGAGQRRRPGATPEPSIHPSICLCRAACGDRGAGLDQERDKDLDQERDEGVQGVGLQPAALLLDPRQLQLLLVLHRLCMGWGGGGLSTRTFAWILERR
jgi:hypothetical protein